MIEKTRDPAALKGERGSILGLWTGNWPGEYAELVFRADGQYRWKSCKLVLTNNIVYYDYGLYAVDMAARTVVLDSRFIDVQTRQLDFYGDTMTLHGGLTNNTPDTYTVNLGSVDAAIVASFAADAAEAQVDAQWLARVPLGPAGPNGTVPFDIGADPESGADLSRADGVSPSTRYYRKLIPRWFYDHGCGGYPAVAFLPQRPPARPVHDLGSRKGWMADSETTSSGARIRSDPNPLKSISSTATRTMTSRSNSTWVTWYS